MTDRIADRLRDRLTVNAPYEGVVATGYETLDADGRLIDAEVRRIRLRSWTQGEIADALEAAGFVDVRALGDDDGWVSLARRPA